MTRLERFSIETGKAQPVRLMDVLLLGPLMIVVGLDPDAPAWLRLALVIAGVGTIGYNARNYLELEQARQ